LRSINNTPLYLGTTANKQLITINDTGHVGIGTTAPGAKLEVDGTFNATGSSGIAGLFVRSDGNVSIGQAAGNMKLDILGDTSTPGYHNTIRLKGYSPSLELLDKDAVQNWYFGINDDASNNLYIGRGYSTVQGVTPAIVVDTSDKVGIGTTSPTHTLHVQGTMNVTRGAGQSGGIEIDGSGNVIIRLG